MFAQPTPVNADEKTTLNRQARSPRPEWPTATAQRKKCNTQWEAFTPKHVHARKRDNAKNDKKENGGPVSQQGATPLLAEHRAHIVGEKRVIHHQKHGISNACEAFADTKHPSPTDRFWRHSAGVAAGVVVWSVVHKNTVYPMDLAAPFVSFLQHFPACQIPLV